MTSSNHNRKEAKTFDLQKGPTLLQSALTIRRVPTMGVIVAMTIPSLASRHGHLTQLIVLAPPIIDSTRVVDAHSHSRGFIHHTVLVWKAVHQITRVIDAHCRPCGVIIYAGFGPQAVGAGVCNATCSACRTIYSALLRPLTVQHGTRVHHAHPSSRGGVDHTIVPRHAQYLLTGVITWSRGRLGGWLHGSGGQLGGFCGMDGQLRGLGGWLRSNTCT